MFSPLQQIRNVACCDIKVRLMPEWWPYLWQHSPNCQHCTYSWAHEFLRLLNQYDTSRESQRLRVKIAMVAFSASTATRWWCNTCSADNIDVIVTCLASLCTNGVRVCGFGIAYISLSTAVIVIVDCLVKAALQKTNQKHSDQENCKIASAQNESDLWCDSSTRIHCLGNPRVTIIMVFLQLQNMSRDLSVSPYHS